MDLTWLLETLEGATLVTVEPTDRVMGEQVEVEQLDSGEVVLRCRLEYVEHVRQALEGLLPARVRGGLFGDPGSARA